MKKTITFSLILLILACFTASSFAQSQRGVMRGKHGVHRSPIRLLTVLKTRQTELQISEDQMKQIQDVVFSFEEKMIALRKTLETQSLELKKLMMQENRDYEKMKAVLSSVSQIRQEMLIDGMKARDEVNGILTKEQKEAVKKSFSERQSSRGLFQRGRFPRGFQRGDRIKD